MTVYNINLGIGWASSGVEYAQAYRSTIFKNTGIKAKFVFMDMFLQDNLSDLTRNMGFADEDIIWLYSYFTDLKIAPTTYTVKDLEKEIPYDITRREINGKVVKLFCAKEDIFYAAYLRKEGEDIVHRVEKVSRGIMGFEDEDIIWRREGLLVKWLSSFVPFYAILQILKIALNAYYVKDLEKGNSYMGFCGHHARRKGWY